ncbi:PTS lactose/cellobiose transporter subunit IIA [Clostridium beijerinckii]|jgi:Phosphotransferase system cellobiose-specific component IIA|uniref:Lichenan-specific phosphotransferase enzyme IIA component n=2 Tax=Clostridium beijerinckii TaxID=1520 RepID=A0A1S8SE62_CLOBE|nr:PTS lactose/cellobiose transporter subunit IIA [Clostridium beijerinckii]ABR36793.1 phosphotransferase system PTS, lactose/cellobiose-specific IIA subunit [Clostridium beijerinckii NCIMB 8052]AIU03134.1 phosphotransferase system PTS, lactose/cellobiose-specific IIA subunit [Clostridium beijerinckii ATCC 35702]MBF7808560.1 PTS lactose/cellobiose transporter subunit IIA [Clostridium beijerinckii]NRT22132.1 PTS system cellobiose-specific IIA component [Clostridium beijerinckii]NRT65358.1 PTS s
MEELELAIMNIIINAGDCKNHAYMALNSVNEGNYEEAEKEMQLANDALAKAHEGQTMFLHKEANGEKVDISVLFVHAQDHLMTAITEKNLIEQIMELRKIINTLVKQ